MSSRLKTPLADPPTLLPAHRLTAMPWWRSAALVGGCLLGRVLLTGPTPAANEDPNVALVQVLAATHGLSASPSDVFWVDPPPPWWKPWNRSRVWILAAQPNGLDDVYLGNARLSPEGRLLDVPVVYNVTDSKATAERLLTAVGGDAAWYSGTDSDLLRVTWATLDRPLLTSPNAPILTRVERLQWHLTWLQDFGEWRGISRRQFKLIPPPTAGYAAFHADELELVTNLGVARLRPHAIDSHGQVVVEQSLGLGKPGQLLTWSVDRLRAVPWFGDDNMQRLKAVVYRVWDAASRRFGLGVSHEATPVALVSPETQRPAPAASIRQPELPAELQRAWPPPDLAPLLTPPEPQEGQWLSLNNDPFIGPTSDPQGLFFTTFLRTDPERTYSRILVTVWDPLTVELHTQSGTDEPKSATGETGSGLVPRQPAVAENLVAAFNGGFQATHGDFGMVADGIVYVPPLPFAAAVATDRAGNVGFGTWPERQPWPSSLVGLRQNLTPLVAHGKFNPYQRTWWGGVPAGWEDDTRTVRSGICLTNDGLVAYFYGAKVDAENLAKAMLAVRCSYGLHLDMNQGHTGLEFYHVAPESKLPPLALTLDHVWQAEGAVPEAPGLAFRGRRMFRAMQLMNFPRYIQRETRDFFYLTRRVVLPRETATGKWSVPASAAQVFPHAAAVRTATTSTGALVQLFELAPEYVVPQTAETGLIVASIVSTLPDSEAAGGEALHWRAGTLEYATKPSHPGATALFPVVDETAGVEALVCVHPQTGNLLYAEVVSATDRSSNRGLLEAVLLEEGCLPGAPRGAPGSLFEIGGRDLSGHPRESEQPRLHLAYRRPKRHFDLYPDTPVVSPAHWKPLQTKPD